MRAHILAKPYMLPFNRASGPTRYPGLLRDAGIPAPEGYAKDLACGGRDALLVGACRFRHILKHRRRIAKALWKWVRALCVLSAKDSHKFVRGAWMATWARMRVSQARLEQARDAGNHYGSLLLFMFGGKAKHLPEPIYKKMRGYLDDMIFSDVRDCSIDVPSVYRRVGAHWLGGSGQFRPCGSACSVVGCGVRCGFCNCKGCRPRVSDGLSSKIRRLDEDAYQKVS